MCTREPVLYIYLRNHTYIWHGQLLKRDMVRFSCMMQTPTVVKVALTVLGTF